MQEPRFDLGQREYNDREQGRNGERNIGDRERSRVTGWRQRDGERK